jgi:hypothetical protein
LTAADDDRVDQESQLVDQTELQKSAQQYAARVDPDDPGATSSEDVQDLDQVHPVVARDELGDRGVGRSRRRPVGVQGQDVGPVAELS